MSVTSGLALVAVSSTAVSMFYVLSLLEKGVEALTKIQLRLTEILQAMPRREPIKYPPGQHPIDLALGIDALRQRDGIPSEEAAVDADQ